MAFVDVRLIHSAAGNANVAVLCLGVEVEWVWTTVKAHDSFALVVIPIRADLLLKAQYSLFAVGSNDLYLFIGTGIVCE